MKYSLSTYVRYFLIFYIALPIVEFFVSPQFRKYVRHFCIFYLSLPVLSFLMSLQLPSFHDVLRERDSNCYWTNALVGFVECGDKLPGHSFLGFFFNLWLLFAYPPIAAVGSMLKLFWSIVTFGPILEVALILLLSVGATLLLYAPLIFLIYSLFRTRRLRPSS